MNARGAAAWSGPANRDIFLFGYLAAGDKTKTGRFTYYVGDVIHVPKTLLQTFAGLGLAANEVIGGCGHDRRRGIITNRLHSRRFIIGQDLRLGETLDQAVACG